jgi:hypothetical protein
VAGPERPKLPPEKGPDTFSSLGESYRARAFELGVDYENEIKKGRTPGFWSFIRGREKGLNGLDSNPKACKKTPCNFKHDGPHTDMKRDAIEEEPPG